ncbi:MAG: metal ABC transporter ATP-binding protein [Acidimicrobiales bacterium]
MTASPSSQDTSNIPPALEVNDLSVAFGDRQVLRGVTFTIRPGEVAGLIGTNGAGKTTLLRAILGLVSSQTGSVSVNGISGRRIHREIGYVPQSIDFDPDVPLRTWDFVALGIDGDRFGLSKRSRAHKDLVDEMLALVGMSAFADQRISALSGGQQQRVMIAHALVRAPRLLLLDEPLANLDLHSASEIVGLLSTLAHERQVGVLVSTHDMNQLLPVMDTIVYVAGGTVAAGPPEEIVTEDSLTKLYGHPVDVLHVRGRVLVIASTEAIDADDPAHSHEART